MYVHLYIQIRNNINNKTYKIMKNLRVHLSENAQNDETIMLQEIAEVLNNTSEKDFQVNDNEIVEYDLKEEIEPIYWHVQNCIQVNTSDTFDIQIDC